MTDDSEQDRPDHLDDVESGGCAEMWERAVAYRQEQESEDEDGTEDGVRP